MTRQMIADVDADTPMTVETNHRARERERGERWARVIVTVLALASVAPFAYSVAESNRADLTERLVDVGSWVERQEANELSAVEAGAYTLGLPVLAAALCVFFGLMWLRRRASERAVVAARAHGGLPRSPSALPLTVGAWSVLVGAAAVFGTLTAVAGGENTSDIAANFVDNPAWILLMPVGIAAAVAMSYWYHRRVHQLEPVGAVQTATARYDRQDDGPPPVSEGLRMFGRALVIEGGFGLVALGQSLLDSSSPAVGDFALEWLVFALVFPGMMSGMFLLLFAAFRPTRWMVDEALAQPLTRVAMGSIAAGLLLALALGGVSAWVLGVGILLTLGGGVLAGATGLYVQDVGPQPWLGIVFLVLLYVPNAFATDQGELGLPDGLLAWVVAVALALFVVRETVSLWRQHYERPARAEDAALEGTGQRGERSDRDEGQGR